MILSNFHTHCYFCDGIGEPGIYVEEAINKGFTALGFSCHAPIPFENQWTMREERVEKYLNTINNLKTEYKGRIEIYTGMEIDYFEGDNREIFNKHKLDYIIGSVHFFPDLNGTYFSVDGNQDDFISTLNEYFGGDIRKFAGCYYKQIIKMLEMHKPDIVGHLDVLKKNNSGEKYFSEREPWYVELIEEVLEIIKKKGTIVEVNTGGITRGYIKDPYPSEWILKECKSKNIPIIVTSDAHSVENLAGCFDSTLSILKEIGYREQMILKDGKWESIPL